MAQEDVDVIAVTVKVLHHRELVLAALAAGKAVYCEWPLGRDLEDARAMAALAAERGVRTVVGLQARQAPAIEFVRELLSDGYVGEVLSTTLVGVSVPGDVVIQPNVFVTHLSLHQRTTAVRWPPVAVSPVEETHRCASRFHTSRSSPPLRPSRTTRPSMRAAASGSAADRRSR